MTDTQAQIEWEHEQVERGIRRYRATLTKTTEAGGMKQVDLIDTEPGRVIATDLLRPVVERIQAYQDTLTDNAGLWGAGGLPFLALDAEVLGATTIFTMLGMSGEVEVVRMSIAIGRAVQSEYEFRLWKSREDAAEQEALTLGEDALNLYKLMMARNKVVDRRVFLKWAQKSTKFLRVGWPTQVLLHVGTRLMAYVVESNAWFETYSDGVGAHKVSKVRFSDLGHAFVADRHNRNELGRPYRLPMIVPPLDYVYVEDKPKGPNELQH